VAVTATISLDSRVRIGPDAVFRELDGEAVILNLETGLYFGLNDVGTRIWRLLEADGHLRRVAEALRDEFDATDDQVGRDLLALIEQLRAKGLLHVEPDSR
jgi:hypothetical protein